MVNSPNALMRYPSAARIGATPQLTPSPTSSKLLLRRASVSTQAEQEQRHQQHVGLLRRCVKTSDVRSVQAIHANLIKTLPQRYSLYLHNHILNCYLKCGCQSFALKLFDEMPQRNVVSYSTLISGLVQKGYPERALDVFCCMIRDGNVRPNEFTLVGSLQACSLSRDFVLLYQVYGCVIRLGYESNVFLKNAVLTGLVRGGDLDKAEEVFEECLANGRSDLVTWNAMMAGYLEFSCSKVPGFWYRMSCIQEGVKPDDFTFTTVFSGLAVVGDLEMGLQVHGQLAKSGLGGDIHVVNSLLGMYLKCKSLADAHKAFREMTCKDVCSWTQMAAGLVECGKPELAVDLVVEMMKTGVELNKFVLATALSASANMASLETGRKFHGLRIKFADEADVCVDNALLDMYVKVGCLDDAWVVFTSMTDRSIVSWTTMITGCAQNGQGRDGLMLFEMMRNQGVEPNYVTFISVLYACSNAGLVEEGLRYFSMMSSEHGIEPGEDHYACIVNLLGRAGRIREAEELISRIPFQPGILVWKTLLGACELHGDVEAGKRAAERAMHLDGQDPSSYVLLSNMLAGLNNWDRVSLLRNEMQDRDVTKVPGSSWI